jgi:prefoldin beta subunit
MSEESDEKINQLSLLEQNLQQFSMQKQQFQAQLAEIDSALTGLGTSKESFKILGNIMIKAETAELKKDLNNKKETLMVRIETLEKQEKKLGEKAESLRKEVMKDLEKKK